MLWIICREFGFIWIFLGGLRGSSSGFCRICLLRGFLLRNSGNSLLQLCLLGSIITTAIDYNNRNLDISQQRSPS
jgi:hypothetical protein